MRRPILCVHPTGDMCSLRTLRESGSFKIETHSLRFWSILIGQTLTNQKRQSSSTLYMPLSCLKCCGVPTDVLVEPAILRQLLTVWIFLLTPDAGVSYHLSFCFPSISPVLLRENTV